MRIRNIYISLIAVFLLIAVIAGSMYLYQSMDANASAETFTDLENLIVQPTVPNNPDETILEPTVHDDTQETVESEMAEAMAAYERYSALYEQNNDFIGWICIEDTQVNYPVMQTIDNPDFYLKRGFDKSFSNYGVPYIDEACATGLSNNIVVYGHNIKTDPCSAIC